MFFFTLVIDKIIQNSRNSVDQEKLNQIIEDQQSQINQLLEQNQNLQKEKQMIKLSMKDLNIQSEESIEKLQDFVIKQKSEIEGYIQRIRELEIEEDPNNLYQNLEIMFHQYNRVFCDVEKQMINNYKENISSLNSFAHSIQENTHIMQNIINNQKNEHSTELGKNYGLTLPQKFQKKQQHPFEFYLIQKWKSMKIDNYEKQEDQQILNYLDSFFIQLFENHPTQKNVNRLFINHMFQNQSNIFKISIKLTEICDYLMIQDKNNQSKRVFYQQLLGLNNKQCFNKINLFDFLNIITLQKNSLYHIQNSNYLSQQQIIQNIVNNCDLKFQDEFIEIMQQKMDEIKNEAIHFYNQQIKKKYVQQQQSQSNALFLKLQKIYNTINFYEIKNNLIELFESLEPDQQNRISYKTVQEVLFKRIKIFTSDPSYENIFPQNTENNQFFKYMNFLIQFQKSCLSIEYDNEYIEEYKFYEILMNSFIEHEKRVQQILTSQIQNDIQNNNIFSLSNLQTKDKICEVQYDSDVYIETLNKNLVLHYLDLLKKQKNLETEEQDVIAQVYNKKQLNANIEESRFRIFKKYMKENNVREKKDSNQTTKKNRSNKKLIKKKV